MQDALHHVTNDRTTIIVAHRMTTIRDVDLIFVFEKGNVVEQGTHTNLMQIDNGIYRALFAQSEREEDEQNDTVDQQNSDESSSRLEYIKQFIRSQK